MTQVLAAINRNFVVNFLQPNGFIIEEVHQELRTLDRSQLPRLVNMRLAMKGIQRKGN
jgi:hypothetical protein